jgi:hypothetical protein
MFSDFQSFWLFYLTQHSKKQTRRWHAVGTSTVLVCVALAVVTLDWRWLLLAPVTAYGLAWYSHFFIEGNKPATFGHPLWSLMADFRMVFLMATGRLDAELEKVQQSQMLSSNR